jgi:excisionase family DNA binding protein
MARKSSALVGTNSSAFQPRCLNISEAAAYLAATTWYMRSLIWERKIPFAKRGNRYVFDRNDLDNFVDAQKTTARA